MSAHKKMKVRRASAGALKHMFKFLLNVYASGPASARSAPSFVCGKHLMSLGRPRVMDPRLSPGRKPVKAVCWAHSSSASCLTIFLRLSVQLVLALLSAGSCSPRLTLLYADELVESAENPQDLQRALDGIEAWGSSWRFSFGIGPEKTDPTFTSACKTRPGLRDTTTPSRAWGGGSPPPLPPKNRYPYLFRFLLMLGGGTTLT